jgi:prepilin-type N-terminal cleavage/methylation domain-containing protein
MVHSKNTNGFTMMESIFAVAIIAVVLTPIFILQGNTLRNVATIANYMQRLFFAADFLQQARQTQAPIVRQFMLEKKENNPQTILKYELSSTQNPALKDIPGILQEKVTITWQEDRHRRSDALVSYVYKPKIEVPVA